MQDPPSPRRGARGLCHPPCHRPPTHIPRTLPFSHTPSSSRFPDPHSPRASRWAPADGGPRARAGRGGDEEGQEEEDGAEPTGRRRRKV
eukprot:8070375-Pyramimonas_sp.AAC.2